MAHSLAKNWIHIIFTTKNRQALISKELESKIYIIFKEETEKMDCYLSRVNGMPDHVHLLVLLHPSKTLADYVKQIKGVSSYHVNQNNWIPDKFSWQKGYGAFSVSKSQLGKVQKYIERQKEHHDLMNLETEWNRFLDINDLNKNG